MCMHTLSVSEKCLRISKLETLTTLVLGTCLGGRSYPYPTAQRASLAAATAGHDKTSESSSRKRPPAGKHHPANANNGRESPQVKTGWLWLLIGSRAGGYLERLSTVCASGRWDAQQAKMKLSVGRHGSPCGFELSLGSSVSPTSKGAPRL